MSITIKFGQVSKDTPTLNVMDGRFPLSAHSPLARPNSEPDNTTPYQVKFPMWFRQNQQNQVLKEIARRFDDMQLQWARLDVPEDDIVWTSKSLFNQEPEAISVFLGPDPSLNTYKLNVDWPATPDRAISRPLNPEAAVSLDSGDYRLKLTAGEDEYDFTVAISQNYGQVDNNREVLKHLAIAINSRQSQVKAKLEETVNSSNPAEPYRVPGRSLRLLLEGQDFSLRDIEGELAASYGLNRKQPGASAKVRVDGALQQSGGNLVQINDLIGVVRESADGPFRVTVEKGPAPLIGAARQFINSYNELIDYMALNNDYLRSSLQDRLIRPQQEMAGRLEAAGLTPDRQGHIITEDSFIQHLVGDYQQTRQSLLRGESAWGPAFMAQMDTILRIGLENYASPLVPQSEEQVRSRAWLELDSLREKIINAYY